MKSNTIYLNILALGLLLAFSHSINVSQVPVIRNIIKAFLDKPSKQLFKVYHTIFGKEYDYNTEEGIQRYITFKKNLDYIKKSNSENKSFKLGVNQFTDLTNEEFRKLVLHRKIIQGEELEKLISEIDYDFSTESADTKPKTFNLDDYNEDRRVLRNLVSGLGDNIDWSSQYGPIRDQANCGSCWAFTAAAVVEGCLAIKNGSITERLSEQQLVDCSKQDSGCDGGLFPTALKYIKRKGLMLESDYPYKAKDQKCKYVKAKANAKITGMAWCSNYVRNKKKKCTPEKAYAILKDGPPEVGIDGGTNNFQSYESGILDDNQCSEDNHAVTIVGYSNLTEGEYWTIRNQWGVSWGEAGYARIKRKDSNHHSCYVNNEVYRAKC